MSENFAAQSLVETKTAADQRKFELTFADARGMRHTITIPIQVAADLLPVLTALAADMGRGQGPRLTKLPKACAVGRAQHERLVLIRFDDDPAYGLDLDEAEGLWRGLREEAELVSRQGPLPRQ